MSIRKEVVFSARDNGSINTIERIRQSANTLGNDILRQAMETRESAQEIVKYYEDQVRAIEKRFQLDQKLKGSQAEVLRNQQIAQGLDPKLADEAFKATQQEIKQGTAEDKLQVELLKELIEAVKSQGELEQRNADRQIQQDKDNITRQLRDEAVGDLIDKPGEAGQVKGNAFDRLREMFRTPAPKPPAPPGNQQQEDDEIQKKVETIRKVVGAGNVQDAGIAAASGLGLLLKNPYVAIGAGIVGTSVIGLKNRADREKAATELAQLTGGSSAGVVNAGVGATNMGGYGPLDLNVTREQFVSQIMPSIIRAAGTTEGAELRAMQSLEASKALGVSMETIQALEKLSRTTEGNTTAQRLATRIYSSAVESGAVGANNMARMQEIISQVAAFQERQLFETGETSSIESLNLMSRLQSLGGNFRRDDYVFDTIGRLDRGLASAGGPQSQAIKFDILRRLNPNMQFFDLQKEMERGIESPGFLQGLMSFVQSSGGDLNTQSLLFDQLTGGQLRKQDISDLLSGRIGFEDLSRDIGEQDIDFRRRATDVSSSAQARLDFSVEAMKDLTDKVGSGVDDILGALNGIGTDIGQIAKAIRDNLF